MKRRRQEREVGNHIIAMFQHISKTNIDEITGLRKANVFYSEASEYVKTSNKPCCMVATDLEHFKLFKNWYGRNKGDELLKRIGAVLQKAENTYECVTGYMGADDFAICMVYDDEVIHAIYEEIKSLVIDFGNQVGFLPSFGVYNIDPFHDGIMDAYDYAVTAIDEGQAGLHERIYYYTNSTKLQAEEDYKIIMDFQKALENGEITFYLQPQLRASTMKVVGAEALARWIKKDGSMVMPMEFIPQLEKTGFIINLDKYIWESVCKWLVTCQRKGLNIVPVSVNVSQVDAFHMDTPKYFYDLVTDYGIDPKYIKIEITESTYAMDEARMDEIVSRFRNYGFKVLMDDFGSGYSSLNMLRNVDVDVIKLDSNFLNGANSSEKRGLDIFEAVVNMTRSLGLPIIVEGVETKEQLRFIKELGCRYAQGFIVRPMPAFEFEKILSDRERLDLKGIRFKSNQQLQVREFLDENVYSDNMLNNILGPVVYFSRHGEHVDIIRYNEQFYEIVGPEALSEERSKDIQLIMSEEDRYNFYNLLDRAYEDKMNGANNVFRIYNADNEMKLHNIKAYYLEESAEEQKFYASVRDITDVTLLRTKIDFLSNYIRSTIVFLEKKGDKFRYEIVLHGLEHTMHMTAKQMTKELETGEFYRRVSYMDDELKNNFPRVFSGNIVNTEGDVTVIIDGGKDVKLHLTAEFAYGQADEIMYVCEIYERE